jgi:hypothetical protein
VSCENVVIPAFRLAGFDLQKVDGSCYD